MTLRDWFDRRENRTLVAALATAVFSGVGVGAWASLPASVSESVGRSSPAQLVLSEDPGWARWRTQIASLGGLASTFTAPQINFRERLVAPVSYDFDQDFEAMRAELENRIRDSERRAFGRDYDGDGWRDRDEVRDRPVYERRVEAARYDVDPYRPYARGEVRPPPPPQPEARLAAYQPPPRPAPSQPYLPSAYQPPVYQPPVEMAQAPAMPAPPPRYQQVRAMPEPPRIVVFADEPIPPPPPQPAFGY